jgi:ketosteroid isomerase-like protein
LLTGRFILKANEKMKEMTGTFSLVFVHTANGWKILHDHSG